MGGGERVGEVARLGWCQPVSVRHGKRPIGRSWLLGQSFSVARRHTDALHRSAEARVLTETYYGFVAETIVPVENPPLAARITGTSEPRTRPKMRNA